MFLGLFTFSALGRGYSGIAPKRRRRRSRGEAPWLEKLLASKALRMKEFHRYLACFVFLLSGSSF